MNTSPSFPQLAVKDKDNKTKLWDYVAQLVLGGLIIKFISAKNVVKS